MLKKLMTTEELFNKIRVSVKSVSGIGEAYREPLLEIIRAYVQAVKIGNPDVGRMDSQKPLSDKKKALMRM